MKKIICVIRPFDVQQSIYCMDGDDRIESVNAKLDNLIEVIISLAKQHEAFTIDMVGPKTFASKYGDALLAQKITDYNLSNLVVNYI